MLANGYLIRKCKLCGGYFKVRYYSNQEYCTRIYQDTSAPCNEYVSMMSYKKRYAEHPINKEYTMVYNRYYGRVSRGVEEFSNDVIEGLQTIHNEYYEKYEEAANEQKGFILEEYKLKN